MAGFEDLYEQLMSPTPVTQSAAAAMLRDFATGAQLMSQHLRGGGRTAADGTGDAGQAASEQAELHAQWFDTVAQNAHDAATKLDAIATQGTTHQATAAQAMAEYQQALAENPNGAQDEHVVRVMQSGQSSMNSAAEQWGSAYGSFSMPAPPPVPTTPNNSGAAAPPTTSAPTPTGGTHIAQPGKHGTVVDTTPTKPPKLGTPGHSTGPQLPPPGTGASTTVGTSGGEFAGWYKDPTTGYYVDPATGREFDPVTSRWIDPVTGLPFGAVTQHATHLEGIGGPATTGGLLSDTGSGGGTFSGLFNSGDTSGVAAGYGGQLPPSLSTGSAAVGSLWQQAGRSLSVKQQVAADLTGREQALRAGRPYTPPIQAGGGIGSLGSRTRPGYVTAEEDEAGLFSSPTRAGGRRPYLPATQAGGKDEKRRAGKRPDWLTDDDVFGAGIDEAPAVLGE